MQTITKWLLAVAAAAPLLAGAQEIQTVKIGFSSPLTGPQAAAGRDNQGGLIMAIEALNARGIVIKGRKIRFEAVIEDDQGDPQAGVNVAQKLADLQVAAIIGPYNSGVALPVSRIYQNAGIVMGTVASNPKVTLQGHNVVFRIAASDSQLGSTMARYAARELKLKKIAIIDDRTAYGLGVASEFERVAKAAGVQITSHDFTSAKAIDFTAILTSLKNKRPDAVFYGGYSPQAAPLLRQMRQLGVEALLLGSDGICAPELGRLASDAIRDQVYCTQGGALLDKMVVGKQFSDDYQKRWGRPAETYAAPFYDGMMVIAQAMQAADSVDPKVYRAALEKIHYKGVSGAIAFDSNHDLVQSPVTVYRFQHGVPSALTSY